jgi:hypothetical protein
MSTEQDARGYVHRYVRYGFYRPDEVEQIVGDDIFDGAIPRDRLREMIAEEVQRKRAEERTWPAVTDCDRLDRVFESLEEQGILALQNAGYTQSDGLSDVCQFYHEAGGERSGIEGYCFYHGQDLERVMASGELCLAFGHVSGEDEPGVEIGCRIKRTFEAAGFTVEWDGSVKTRLLVKDIRWQRRRCPA